MAGRQNGLPDSSRGDKGRYRHSALTRGSAYYPAFAKKEPRSGERRDAASLTRPRFLVLASEACSNASEHAYAGERSEQVRLTVQICGPRLEIVVADGSTWKPPAADVATTCP
jgi:hypothetical protein